ncbi:MAG: hypothetical protein HY319_03435 [Armatimonadetes bacterium]|nr:hypothetical protein [Armatimonadota bacterium]
MEFHFLEGQGYDCVRCAKGCRSRWRMHVDPYSQKRIEGSTLELRVIQESGGPALLREDDGAVITAKRNGQCVFLRSDNLCAVHAEMGMDAKPIGCRQFPFMIRPTPDGVVVGVSFYCTAVQQNTGRLLAEHRAEVEALMQAIRFAPIGDEPLPVVFDCRMTWDGYRRLEALIRDGLEKEGLEAASLRGLVALARASAPGALLEAAAVDEAFPAEFREDPDLREQMRFFRMALVAFVEAPDPAATPALTQNLLEGEEVELPRWNWRGSADELVERREYDSEIDRYGRALLHRKFLAQDRPLYQNLALLHLLPGILRFYTAVAAQARGDACPQPVDYFRALDLCEIDLVTHARGLEPLYAAFAEGYLKLLG